MRLTASEVTVAAVPMDQPFGHAAAQRSRTAGVLLRLRSGETEGWGEGAPRPYVTGETLESVVEQLTRLDLELLGELIGSGSFEARIARLARLAGAPMARLLDAARPAASAAAALELALLDLVCRSHDRPLDDVLTLLGLPRETLRDQPAPVVPAEVVDLRHDPGEVLGAMPAAARAGLRHVKVKVDGDLAQAVRRARAARAACPHTSLSLDANCGWDPDAAVGVAGPLREAGVDWVEEPFRARDWTALRRLVRTGLGVMLDESFRDEDDLRLAVRLQAATHVNIRVSKCGGLVPSARLADRAREAGLRYQLGVQVGEVGPLWAGGRTLACRLADPCAVETGRQDEWFREPLTEPPYAVDRGGPVAHPLTGAGCGVRPSARLVRDVLGPPPVPVPVPAAQQGVAR